VNRQVWLSVACLLIAVPFGAAAEGEISGVVLDDDSGKPIHHARVTATTWIGRDQRSSEVLVVLTGDDGRFRFTALPEGGYEIRAQRFGYLNLGSEKWPHIDIPREPGQPLTMRLSPLGTIHVRVLDNHAAPVMGAQIQVTSSTRQAWEWTTDNSGALQARLPRGSYQIEAVAPGPGSLLSVRSLTFPSVYYPGTILAARAESVNLVPGRELEIELRVAPTAGQEIRGHLDVDGTLVSVRVRPVADDNVYLTWGTVTLDKASRDFRVSGLAPGSYSVNLDVGFKGSGFSIPFHKTVQVSEAPVTDVVISSADRLPGW